MALFDSKTEAATPKRRDDARKKGQVAKSREIVSVAVLIVGVTMLRVWGPVIWGAWRDDMMYYLSEAIGGRRLEALQNVPLRAAHTLGLCLLPYFGAVMLVSIIANVAQTGPMLISDPLKWDFTRLNPAEGFKRLVSKAGLVELAKSIAKIALVGWIVFRWVRGIYPEFLTMAQMQLPEAAQFASHVFTLLFRKIISTFFLIAVLDFVWQRVQHETSLKMTKDEVKREWRQQEGSPEVRNALRRRARDLTRNRMMAAVKTATVVITNPTHYAVALRYAPEIMDAPQVIALGQRLTALRIRELAEMNDVPIVENPPLARALFAACQLGDLVPRELYAAVAEVLAFVYRLQNQDL
jgi:flagellar biosynthetic protein FlhB